MSCFSLGISAQETYKGIQIDTTAIVEKQFDAEHLEDYRNDSAFDYSETVDEPNFFDKIWTWVKRVFRKILSWFFDDIGPALGFFGTLLVILPYLILGIVLFLIINFFLKVNARNALVGKNNQPIVHLEDDEEIINSKDLPRLIAMAIEEENYRLAVRYYYLMTLQKLSDKKMIVWEQQKTNEDYIKEMTEKAIQPSFKDLTWYYDCVWYGNFEIDKRAFEKTEEDFKKLIKKINA